MDILAKCTVLAIFGVMICQLIKKHNPELSFALSAIIAVSVLLSSCLMLSTVKDFLSFTKTLLGNSSEFVKPILKCLSIGLISRFGSELCKDASMNVIASAVEIGGTLCAAGTALPVILSTLSMIGTIV